MRFGRICAQRLGLIETPIPQFLARDRHAGDARPHTPDLFAPRISTTTDPKPCSNAEVVLGAIEDMPASRSLREILAELTGLKLTTIDDRLGHLVDTGKIRRVQRGYLCRFEQHRPASPSRARSARTARPCGRWVTP